jgi:Holliday junction DNA helicase RuvB
MTTTIRPKTLEDFKLDSNEQAVNILRDAIKASKIRKTILPHILLYGPAGTGKTTLGKICAHEMKNTEFIETIGSAFHTPIDILKYLTKIYSLQNENKNAILFIDEIHDLGKKNIPETLWYTILEDYIFFHNVKEGTLVNDLVVEGNTITLKPFTIIGATTDPALLKKPMRDRFKITCALKDYSEEDLQKIIKFNVNQKKYNITETATKIIANNSRGNPRIAVNFIESCENKRLVTRSKQIDNMVTRSLFKDFKIRKNGITENDLSILKALSKHPRGSGINTLAGIVNIDKRTLSDMYLSYLDRIGYTITTHRRFITDDGLKYLRSARC